MRVFSLLAMVFFGALMVIFIVVTVDQFGRKQYVTDNVAGLPPVYVITALLVPFCAAFVAGFWALFMDSFKRQGGDVQEQPPPPSEPDGPGLRERVAGWTRAHRRRWPRRAE